MADRDAVVPLPAGRSAVQADGLEVRIVRTGESLLESLGRAIEGIPDPPRGPQALARRLGIDKVLASRVLSALRSADPLFVVHRSPGPEPLRRTLDALAKQGVDRELVAGARAAVDQFEQLIRDEVGDRAALDAIVAAWLPEARREFELRRKQAAHKAMSHLRGAVARTIMATVMLAPSESDPDRLDVVWLNGMFGIARLRPRAGVKIVTRRFAPEVSQQRRPLNLAGEPIEEMHQATLEEFCSRPAPAFEVVRAGDAVHYSLAGDRYGPRSAVDLVMAEVNRAEMRRAVPAGSGRKGYVFAEVSTPAESLQFDAILHRGVYPGSTPSVRVYDTSFEGVADANNPARDIDVLEMLESVEALGEGAAMARSPDVPRYPDLLRHVHSRLGWREEEFRAFRCRVEYPVYGSQVTLLFDPPTA